MMVVRYIYLFRHGQTYYNKKEIFTGWKDSKLTPKGIKQAKIIAKKLKNKKIQIFFQTDLVRSKQTLKKVIKYHPEVEEIITANRMIERSYGDLEGTSHKSFIKKMGRQHLNLREGRPLENMTKKDKKIISNLLGIKEYHIVHRGWNNCPPNGESFAMVEKRVKIFIKNLKKFIKKERVNVAISGHGNSIRLFRKIWEKKSKDECVRWDIPYDKVFTYKMAV